MTKYIINPDVSCREEGPDGALLFNPDTNQVVVLNVTGLLIWEALASPRTRDEVVEVLLARCDNVPQGVADHVGRFISELETKGFVGIYQEDPR